MIVVCKQKQNYVYTWLHGISKILGKKATWILGKFLKKKSEILLSLSEIKERDSDSF